MTAIADPFTLADVEEAARILYGNAIGSRWQTALAEDLTGVRGRPIPSACVSQWANARRGLPAWLAAALVRVLDDAVPRLAARGPDLLILATKLHGTHVRHLPDPLRDLSFAARPAQDGTLPEPPDGSGVTAMTPGELCEIADALYEREFGRRWQSALSRDLEAAVGRPVSSASISQWLSHRRPMPRWLAPPLLYLLKEARFDAAARHALAIRLSCDLVERVVRHLPGELRALAGPGAFL